MLQVCDGNTQSQGHLDEIQYEMDYVYKSLYDNF
jgi:hypothetical protein